MKYHGMNGKCFKEIGLCKYHVRFSVLQNTRFHNKRFPSPFSCQLALFSRFIKAATCYEHKIVPCAAAAG